MPHTDRRASPVDTSFGRRRQLPVVSVLADVTRSVENLVADPPQLRVHLREEVGHTRAARAR